MLAAARIDRGPLGLHDLAERVEMEAPGRMHGDRRGFVDHEETVGVMKNSDGSCSYGWFVAVHNVRDHVANGCEREEKGSVVLHSRVI